MHVRHRFKRWTRVSGTSTQHSTRREGLTLGFVIIQDAVGGHGFAWSNTYKETLPIGQGADRLGCRPSFCLTAQRSKLLAYQRVSK